MSKVIPKNVKQTDFFTSILKMFNLWVDIDPDNDYNLIIKPRDSYLGTTELNIHELIDRSKPIKYIPMGALDARRYLFNFKEDGDFFNQLYKSEHGEIYGNRRVDVNNEFYTQDKNTDVIFSPTPLVALPGSDRVLPTIYQMNEAGQPIKTKHNIRILYYAGLKPCTYAWNHINYVSVYSIPLADTYTEYPYAGHLDDPFDPTIDINFGMVKEVYYDDTLHDITWTDENLVNAYHGKYLREITDRDSRIVTAYVRLSPAMYQQFTFDKIYFFDFAYFRLQKIENYNPTMEETVLCTFLKINDASAFARTLRPVNGAAEDVSPGQTGGDVDMNENLPAKGSRASEKTDGNIYTSKSVDVKGSYNYIGLRAENVQIYGDSNKVYSEASNIQITGSDNIVEAGLENVVLINTDGVTVTESNQTYINGKIADYNNVYTPSTSNETNLDASPSMGIATYTVEGDMVMVTGYFTADATTSSVATSFEMSLPIPSSFTSLEECIGMGISGDNIGEGVQILANTANDTAEVTWIARDNTAMRWSYFFKYRVV
jgi:hypothetical protein